MFEPIFLTMIFLHVAFGLALAFVIFYFARNTEGFLRLYGNVTAWFIIITSVFAMIFSFVHVTRHSDFPRCPYLMHEKMKEMQKQDKQTEQTEEPEDEITGGACPVIMNDD